jgi:hypothetical protein
MQSKFGDAITKSMHSVINESLAEERSEDPFAVSINTVVIDH